MSDLVWTPARVKLGQIRPWEHNPRMSTKAQANRILRSFRDLGQIQTIAIGPAEDGLYPLYDGHQRVAALFTVKTPDYELLALQSNRQLTEDERRQVAVLLHTATGGWDWNALSGWSAADLREWGMDNDTLKGWQSDAKELTELLNSEHAESADAEPQISRADELLDKWQVETGDLWQIGEHRLLCGDSTKREDIDKLFQNEKVRFEFSDPPYEMVTNGGGILKTAPRLKDIEKNNLSTFDPLSLILFCETSLFCCNKPLIKSYIELSEKLNISWDLCFFTRHDTAPNFGGHMMSDTEYIFLLGKQSPNSGMEKAAYSKSYFDVSGRNRELAWAKPVGLVEKFLRLYSLSKDCVLDRFAGSGTTLVACQNLGRRGRAIEISPAYCSVILERMSTAFPELEIKRL